jgi:DNA helicase-2/ATP-dependent DNA helicase PcrA
MISKAKSKGKSAEYCLAEAKSNLTGQGSSDGAPLSLELIVAEVYVDYKATLKKNNALDFDDLLVYGVKLFSKHSSVASWCQHILVDEL